MEKLYIHSGKKLHLLSKDNCPPFQKNSQKYYMLHTLSEYIAYYILFISMCNATYSSRVHYLITSIIKILGNISLFHISIPTICISENPLLL